MQNFPLPLKKVVLGDNKISDETIKAIQESLLDQRSHHGNNISKDNGNHDTTTTNTDISGTSTDVHDSSSSDSDQDLEGNGNDSKNKAIKIDNESGTDSGPDYEDSSDSESPVKLSPRQQQMVALMSITNQQWVTKRGEKLKSVTIGDTCEYVSNSGSVSLPGENDDTSQWSENNEDTKKHHYTDSGNATGASRVSMDYSPLHTAPARSNTRMVTMQGCGPPLGYSMDLDSVTPRRPQPP